MTPTEPMAGNDQCHRGLGWRTVRECGNAGCAMQPSGAGDSAGLPNWDFNVSFPSGTIIMETLPPLPLGQINRIGKNFLDTTGAGEVYFLHG